MTAPPGVDRRSLLLAGPLAAAGFAAQAQTPAPAHWTPPTDAEIKGILADRIDVKRQGMAIVVGIIDARGRRIVSHGRLAAGDPRHLDGDTEFEIGSQTKVFTSLLLTDAVRRGEVRLDQPVAELLPADVKVPERNGRKITLIDLATHTSGLPRMPTNFAPADPGNPYADYTAERMFAFLSGYTLPRDIGSAYEYSNFGAGLLGQALARRTGMDYATLVRRRITGPLGMNDTAVTLSPAQTARFAVGHNQALEPVPHWDLVAFAGAGALRSTTNDILTFLAAELGFRRTPLAAAMADELAVRRPTNTPGMDVSIAWHINRSPVGDIVWHNGGTGGFRTWMGFDPKARVGATVMTNVAIPVGGDDIGMHLLSGTPIANLPPARQAVPRTVAELAPLAGTYVIGPNAHITVAQEGPRLFFQVNAQPRSELFSEGPDDFFLKAMNVQVTFERGAAGGVTGMVVHQGGFDVKARRAEP